MSKRESYRLIVNEGGEGYNPHAIPASEIPEWAAIGQKIERLMSRLVTMSSTDTRWAQIKTEITTLEARLAEIGREG